MPTILGVNLGRELVGGGLKPWKNKAEIRGKKSPSEFAEKFAGNVPKIRQAQIKNHPTSTLQNLGLKSSSET